jgi:hypothetical protein
MWPYFTIALQGHIKQVWLYIEKPGKLLTGSVKFYTYLSARILYALSTNYNRLVEETFPASKSQKNKWEADFININFKTENVCNNWKEKCLSCGGNNLTEIL